jgi:competence protein ComGC
MNTINKEPESKMWLLWLIIVIVVLSLVIFIAIKLTAKDYEKLIVEKQQQIQVLQQQSEGYEMKMNDYKAKAKYLANAIVKSSQRINTLKQDVKRQKEISINPPETTEETIRRLKEAGFDSTVECK